MNITPQTKLKDLKTPEDFLQAGQLIEDIVRQGTAELEAMYSLSAIFKCDMSPPKCRRNAD